MDINHPATFFLFFMGLWILVLLLLARRGGWQALAQWYSVRVPFTGSRWYLQRATMRSNVSYNSCLTVGANEQGLYLAMLFLLRPGHPPLFAPWRDITIIETRSWLFTGIELHFRQVPSVPLILGKRLAERLAAAAGRAWPGVSARPASEPNPTNESKTAQNRYARLTKLLVHGHWAWIAIGAVVTIIFGTMANLSCLVQPAFVPLNIEQLNGSGQIYFVPFDDFPRSRLEALAQYYYKKYGLTVAVKDPLPLPASAFNPDRQQFTAEALTAYLASRYPSRQTGERTIPIGFTMRDMYIGGYNWRYAFSYRDGQRAVVSFARMDYGFLWPASQDKQEARLRKMVTKNIGILYYQLPGSDHCRSVLFKNVGGTQELDFMGEDF